MNNYLFCPGVSSNGASTPDSAPLSILGDVDFRALLALPSWAPAAPQHIIGQRNAASATDSGYAMRINAGGALELYWGSGAVFVAAAGSTISSVATGFSAWAARWVRATRVAATATVTFYTSLDGITWTQLGAAQTGGGTANANNSTQAMRIGDNNAGGEQLAGKVFYAEIRNGVNGAIVGSPDFRAAAEFAGSLADAQGNTWTLAGSTFLLAGGGGLSLGSGPGVERR